MNVNDIYPSKYVKAHDLGDKNVTVTVKSAAMEDLGYGKEAERKLVIHFDKATKGLILNRTNAMIIASMYGPETDNWLGQPITLYAARVKAFGAWHDAVRVREQIPARNVGASRIPEAMTEAPPLDDEDDLLDVDEGQAPPRVDPDTGEIMEPGVTLDALKRERLNIEMSDLSKDHEARELAAIDAKIAAAQATPEAPTATPAQHEDIDGLLKEFNRLGLDLYGDTWEQVCRRNVKRISGNTKLYADELTAEEMQMLIHGMSTLQDKRKAEQAKAQEAAA